MKNIFLIALFFLIQISVLLAIKPEYDDVPARIKGIIKDAATQQPMEYANVAVYNANDSTLIDGSITNEEGEFEIMGSKRVYTPVEIDFETGICSETDDSKMLHAVQRVRGLGNPYIGNKRKLLPWIIRTLEEHDVKFDSSLDLFAGSHCLSIVMKLMGKRVISNDILLSSSLYGRAFVANNHESITTKIAESLFEETSGSSIFAGTEWESRFTDNEQL
ncbi:MAG: DNA adenine methylase, partial [Prolixibacteraceae bacterium]